MRARLIKEVGTRASLRVYWGDKECPSCNGSGTPGYHNAHLPLGESEQLGAWDLGGKPEDYPAERWPTKCDHCGAAAVPDATKQIFRDRLYSTPSGKPEPGTIYEAHWYPEDLFFDGEKRHLICVLPNGATWHMTGRASNCTMPADRAHRCWVIHEEAPGVFHVDKNGHTCAAGSGSIAAPGWHGFLRHGELVQC